MAFVRTMDSRKGCGAIASFRIGILVIFVLWAWPCWSSDAQWVWGRWQLSYDPDNAKTDWLDFLPNGDAYNIWHGGEKIAGFYITTSQGVKAVFTYKQKDVIMTFHYDATEKTLAIVTSKSGKASIYKKIKTYRKNPR